MSKKTGKPICGVAQTPRGRFRIQYRIPGWRESDLGKLYNPLYFNGGFAIHGAPSVPAYNASHGCVRISVASSKWFFDSVKNGTPVILFD
jgi:lipoprotein-anchoring transpeptidase ErfK/SrfK